MLRNELHDARRSLRNVREEVSGSRRRKKRENWAYHTDIWQIYPCEVFRSCRKQSYDSETTEDETTEPQMESKEGAGRQPDKAGRRGHTADGGRMTDYLDASDQRSTLPGSYDPVVERELRALGTRPPGSHLDPTNPARCSDDSTVSNSINTSKQKPDKAKPSDPQSSAINSAIMTPKLARAGPKIFDKVRAFEERRASVDLPGAGASSGSDESGKKTGGLQGVSQKRAAFKQRASSLEDKTSYSQKVQSYQSKFAEELQRIKKLVGKPSLKKAFSTEQLSQKNRLCTEKLEPIPSQVVKKLEARERALEEREATDLAGHPHAQGRGVKNQSHSPAQPESTGKPVNGSSLGNTGKKSVTMETAPFHQLPGQPLPTAIRTGPIRESPKSSLPTEKDALVKTSQKSLSIPRDQGTSSIRIIENNKADDGKSIPTPPKPPRLTALPTQSTSPLQKRRKAEAGDMSPTSKAIIPTILVEDEPMETKGEIYKHRHTLQPAEEAGEESSQGPRFNIPLQDTMAQIGSQVKLTCTINGSPPLTVTWKKDNVQIRTDAFHQIKAVGEKHSLVIKEMRLNNAGSYCVTAVNAAGRSSCRAMLFVQTEPVQSNDACLAPEEELMEVRDSQSQSRRVHFKEPPSFQVAPCDQWVAEGQDIVICAKVRGQPKPSIQWLKDNLMVKTAGRYAMLEVEDGIIEMRISAAQRSDAGLYVCKIVNKYGQEQARCSVEVRAGAVQTGLTITREVDHVSVKAGETAVFDCYATGPPDMDVDWLSNGKLIQPALLNCKMHFDGKRCRLSLHSVHEDDSGKYTCKLSTAKEEMTSSANLKVTPSKEPLFTRKLDILEVIEGRTARFNCKVSGCPAPRVTWMHFETQVKENDNVHILQEGGRHSLVICHVSCDTEGFYTAVAENIYGKAECTAELYMLEARTAIASHMAKLEKMPSIPEEPEVLENEVERRTMPDFVKPLADAEVIEGKEAVLKCKVAGLPYPTIAWYHNSKRIESSEERKMTQHRDVHSLIIRSACHAHGGVYKAVISNKVGKAACYAHLYVTDIVPDPPDGPPVIEAITGKTISLIWKAPKRLDASSDVGLLFYVVQQQPLGSIQWSVVASNLRETNYTVTSLSKGVRYAFRVLSSTGKTLSKPSPSTDLVQLLDRGPYLRKAPVILDKPEIVYMVEGQPVNITITLNHVHAVVTWKRRGVPLVSKPGMYEMSMPDDDQHTLRLQRVRSTDVGQLVVVASNQFGSDLCTFQLAMAVAPKFENIMEDVDVPVGETSRLAVMVEGKPDPDIMWYKDDTLLSESSHFTFVYDDPEFSLVVLNAQPEHSGVYTCTAKNQAGSNSCKAELTVHTERQETVEPMEDEGTILRKMRRLTDYYDVHKEVGRGAFSYVKRVTLKKEKMECAAKFICARGKRKSLAIKEMDLLSELDNDKILYFHDAFEKKNILVLITEFCHEELLDRMTRKTTVMESEIRSSVLQLLEGLQYLHQKNVAHLDIKPENILMKRPGSEHICICDFGNAVKLEPSDECYCKYGTPEYVAPEIVNQTPVSTATDIWPVGVITYLCLTGVSPFAGENDRATALNIRNYNVAFEESMFSDLCKEAKGFVIKLLVVDRLRLSANEGLRHPWFKSPTNKRISTALLKQVLTRRRWQRSLINYKSKMVMRSIPELLDDSSSHISIAVARNLKEGSPPPSSSSDSDADVDELPFIPMPLSVVFSGSRVSINEIPGDEDVAGTRKDNLAGSREDIRKIQKDEEIDRTKRSPLKKGSSVESDESQTKARRLTMRRGSSADSALLLQIDPDEGKKSEEPETSNKSLKKAVSMELPNRSPSPGAAKLSQEDYALKLELMRQRLLRGGSMDKKMSGLRGPLFETLGMDDNHTESLDRNLRKSRAGQSMLIRAASSENPGEETPKTKVFRKSSSFTQEDSEPMPLHRRFGAPLEIPSVVASGEGRNLQEATSMSALTEQTVEDESASAMPTERVSFVFPRSERWDQLQRENECIKIDGNAEKGTKAHTEKGEKSDSRLPTLITPVLVIEDEDTHEEQEENQLLHHKDSLHNPKSVMQSVSTPSQKTTAKANEARTAPALPEHPAVFAKVATAERSPDSTSSSNPDLASTPRQPVLKTDIKDIDSEELFQAKFKKRESSLTRGLRKLTRNKSEEQSPVTSRKVAEGGEEIYRPGPRGAPLEMVSKELQEKSKSVQDLRSEDESTGLSLIGRFSLRSKRSTSSEKKGEIPKDEKQADEQEPASSKRVSWAVGRSKSLDTKELNSAQKQQEKREQRKVEDSSVSSMRRKFESKVAGISAKIRTQSEERKDKDTERSQKELANKGLQKIADSPVLAMRQRFENKVAGITSKIRSQSEERKANEERAVTPLFSRHRHSQSEGRDLKGMGIPENQLAKQTCTSVSKESVESTSSVHSEKVSESDRRSRWDRWGLTRSRKDKTPSQPDLLSAAVKEDNQSKTQQFIRSPSDFAPVFHIKLKDHVFLEGEPLSLSCLPAGSPHPDIQWMKDRKPLENDRISLISHPDGRQILNITKSCHKDAGVYECVATNPIATITTSCRLSIASIPKRPGTPEVAQTYNNTALVLWKPTDTNSPCSYTLERRTEGNSNWVTVATAIADCYYNVTDLPPGGAIRFRVCCVNKAGQGSYSNLSAIVRPDSKDNTKAGAASDIAIVKTVPTSPEQGVSSSATILPLQPVQDSPLKTTLFTITSDSTSSSPKEEATLTFSSQSAFVSPKKVDTLTPSHTPQSSPTTEDTQTITPSPVKSSPAFILPKSMSPINVVTPMTQVPSISNSQPLVTPPSTPTKPAVASVPTYAPATTARVAPTPVSFSPQVLQSSSLSPIADGASTPPRSTPSGRTSTALRQGVPQKPYTFLDEKARGRFGVIRECRENSTGKIYMAKIISYSQENKADILKEYEILKSLHNEKIMALHEAYVTPRYLVLVTEYCTGKELLYSLIDRFRYSEDDVVAYLVQILQGVEYLHNRRVLHLDLKPDNIMVTNLNAIKIVDFGSAQSFNPLSLKHQHSGAATLEYMAPEMVKGDVVGPPADIWTIGVVTHIMLSGRLPFEDKDPVRAESKILLAKFDPTKLYPNVSQSASTFLKKMLSSYPWARPNTRDCFSHAWMQDSYLMKLRRQTLTFTTGRLKEFLVEQQSHRSESATKHKVLLRTYQSSPQSSGSGTHAPSPK
ncbi:striated muscle preferentially expressed protein kinase-like isoform X2 [Gouania willdenowi]|uniref:striated muscle preferentially expressed protein kinase-like isoform X2 n=1 Tax=Gouania willdenowi TaxID=441366 RepID=UPI00105488F8|nr:striated muscle preferentially expressed protein kinase isoform X2 [Gouania willdenowi]